MAEVKTAPKPVTNNGNKPAEVRPAPVETKAERFRRLANMRVPVAIKKIRHVGNLGFRNSYEYTDDQAAKIVELLDAEVKALKLRFAPQGKPDAVASIF